MTWDPMLLDEWPAEWVPFTVEVQPDGDVLVLAARGHIDGWTAGALLRTLVAVYEPSFRDIHLDLRQVLALDATADDVLERCRGFADSHGARLHVSVPPVRQSFTATPRTAPPVRAVPA